MGLQVPYWNPSDESSLKGGCDLLNYLVQCDGLSLPESIKGNIQGPFVITLTYMWPL